MKILKPKVFVNAQRFFRASIQPRQRPPKPVILRPPLLVSNRIRNG